MFYLIGLGVGLVLSLTIIVPGMDRNGDITINQFKKSFNKVFK
tara:strand:- start:1048 stop:1176 length:129 start_codon:yes stop_codon:yes gene_type:complete